MHTDRNDAVVERKKKMKITGITDKEKKQLIKLRDAVVTSLVKFSDALDTVIGDAPTEKAAPKKRAKKAAEAPAAVEAAAPAKLPAQHPGMKVVKAKSNGAAQQHEGIAEL